MSSDDEPEQDPQQVETTAGPWGERRTLVVQNIRDERGWSRRELHADEDGSLVIEGHDLGSGVSDFWGQGMGQYEFTRTVSPAGVVELRLSMGIGDAPLLESLGSRFSTTRALEEYLEAKGIETEFWSWVTD
jgi:hypothetical protein